MWRSCTNNIMVNLESILICEIHIVHDNTLSKHRKPSSSPSYSIKWLLVPRTVRSSPPHKGPPTYRELQEPSRLYIAAVLLGSTFVLKYTSWIISAIVTIDRNSITWKNICTRIKNKCKSKGLEAYKYILIEASIWILTTWWVSLLVDQWVPEGTCSQVLR